MERKNLFKALAAFQSEVPVIHEGTEGYDYTYASLGDIIRTITPLLKKHNLGFTQLEQGDMLETIIFETTSGESMCAVSHLDLNFVWETVIKWNKWKKREEEVQQIRGFERMNDQQAKGAVLTYTRRYALSAALGLITDKDTDGKGTPPPSSEARGEQTPKPKQEEKPKPKPKPKKITKEQWAGVMAYAAKSKANRDAALVNYILTKTQRTALEKMHPEFTKLEEDLQAVEDDLRLDDGNKMK